MISQFKYQIFSGPLEEDWLVAEILYGNEHIGDLVEWGEKFVLYSRKNGEVLQFPVDEFIETINTARERVRFIPKGPDDVDE